MCSDKRAPWKNGKNLTLWKFSWTCLRSCQWQIFIVIAIQILLSEFWIIFVRQSLMIDTMPLDEKYTLLGLRLSTVHHQPLSHLQAPCLVQSFHPVHPIIFLQITRNLCSSIADSHWRRTGQACRRADKCPDWDTRGLQGNQWWRQWEMMLHQMRKRMMSFSLLSCFDVRAK